MGLMPARATLLANSLRGRCHCASQGVCLNPGQEEMLLALERGVLHHPASLSYG